MREQSKMNTQLVLGALVAALAHVPMQDIGNLAAGAQLAQQGILNNHFSEQAEEDADHTGMIYAMRAGYNPVGMYAMLMCLKQQEDRSPDVELGYLRDHPLTGNRLASARAELISLGNPITPQSLRRAEGTMIAAVTMDGPPDKPTAALLMVGTTQIAKFPPSERDNAESAATTLNRLLDQNLQLYEVKADGTNLMARDTPVYTFSPADVAVAAAPTGSQAKPVTPEQLASSAASSLRNLLWKNAVTGTSENDIEVGATVSANP
jgi:predicted Zn-dependent protease